MKISKTQRLIDEIMDNFDFSKVAKTMQLLKWEIYMGGDYENREIPDESYLRSCAPAFSNPSCSSISFAIVTPSLTI